MPHDNEKRKSLSDLIPVLCKRLEKLRTGDLAELRRMDVTGPGTGTFWRLAVKHDLPTNETGIQLVKLLAILTPKGDSQDKKLHDPSVPLGKLLAAKPSDNNPLFSETRLLRFLALPFDKRSDALERMCRMIAAKGHNGVNCIDIASLLLSADVKHTRNLAQHYFSNLTITDSTNAKDEAV